MNADRRLAFFTASNIDGATWINIDRKTGLPKEAAEATETWFIDPRIEESAQCDQSLYDNQKPKRVFDRGHLVRRQDPSWGTPIRAKRADADTFHFANCTPQGVTFNESEILAGHRTIYFGRQRRGRSRQGLRLHRPRPHESGPRLPDGEGPKILEDCGPGPGRQIGRDGVAGRSVALIQTPPRAWRARRWKPGDDTTKVKEFLSSVAEIEKLTGLDFGKTGDHDTKLADEAIAQPLTSFEQIPSSPKRRRRGASGKTSGANDRGNADENEFVIPHSPISKIARNEPS